MLARISVLAALALLAAPARAQTQTDPASVFGKKTITIYVGNTAGGNYDLMARLTSRHLGKHIPGRPEVVVSNMNGAASLTAVQYLDTRAPRDGTVLHVPAQDVALSQALGRDGVDFNVTNFNWIGRMAPSIDFTVTWHTQPVKTIEDAKTREVTAGATGGSTSSQYPKAMNALLGTKFKIIMGFKSVNEENVAIERGEIHGRGGTIGRRNDSSHNPMTDIAYLTGPNSADCTPPRNSGKPANR